MYYFNSFNCTKGTSNILFIDIIDDDLESLLRVITIFSGSAFIKL